MQHRVIRCVAGVLWRFFGAKQGMCQGAGFVMCAVEYSLDSDFSHGNFWASAARVGMCVGIFVMLEDRRSAVAASGRRPIRCAQV